MSSPRVSLFTVFAGVLVVGVALSVSVVAQHTRAVDLDGLPDLIVRQDMLAKQWVVRNENLPADFCSVVEGGVTPGVRRLLRFSVFTPNVGDADVYIGDPQAHVMRTTDCTSSPAATRITTSSTTPSTA